MNAKTVHQKHFIIGLTGNIGTGKSLVRKMLQHLGAYGIDADALTQKALYSDSPAISEVVQRFGTDVLDDSGKLDRVKIAQIVFNDKKSLKDLELILHPLVTKITMELVKHARLPIIVIEAIKLLDSDLADICDSIWVVDAQEEIIFNRLASNRGMDREQIIERLSNQSSSQEMKKIAHVVIENNKDILATWHSVCSSWNDLNKTNLFFSECLVKTIDLLSPYKDKIVLPEAEIFTNIKKFFTLENRSMHSCIWLAEEDGYQKDVTSRNQKDFIWMALSQFMFTFQSTNKNTEIIVCDLAQFDLTLTGYSLSNLSDFDTIFSPILEIIENFGLLHMSQRIIIPLNNTLKERTPSFRKLEYKLLSAEIENFQRQDKTGYNLYQKNISENIDIFSRH